MIPFFAKGDPLSAGKFNALGDSIRAMSAGSSAIGELPVPQHFDALPLPEMDFAVMYRKDDAGEWGWCCHHGRVIVKGKDHPVGEKEWELIANDDYTGDIKLVVTLDDDGEFASGSIEKGEAEEGSDTTREFALATIDKELAWKHSGGPVYVTDECCVVGGTGIEVEGKRESGKMIYTVKELYSLSFVSGPGIAILDGMDEEKKETRVINVIQIYQITLIAGPGIEIELEEEGDKPGEIWKKFTITASTANMCVVAGHGIIIQAEKEDEKNVFIVHSKYYMTLVAGTGIAITPESSTDPKTGVITESLQVSTRIQVEKGNEEIKVNRDGSSEVLRFKVYGMKVCVVGGPGIEVDESNPSDMERIYTVKLCVSLILGPGLYIDYSNEEKITVDICWVADELRKMGWTCAGHS